jgi:ATP-dependent Lon protease
MKNLNTNTVPILPMKNLLLFPGIASPIRVGRAKSIKALLEAQASGGLILALLQKATTKNDDKLMADDLHRVGTLCKIEKIRGDEKKGFQIILRGLNRFRTTEIIDKGKYFQGVGDSWEDVLDVDYQTRKALLESLKTLSKELLALLPAETEEFAKLIDGLDDINYLSHLCTANMNIDLELKQEVLELVSIKSRILRLMEIMQNYKGSLQVQSDIRQRLTQKLGKNQREAILREQLKAIHEELGDSDEIEGAKDDYKTKIEKAKMPTDVKKVALEELKRLESLGNSSPETHVIRNYLDLLCAMPWAVSSDEEIDIEKARVSLDQDHYGLPKIKKRILQHLAVMKLKKNKHGSILLFVGPPGVGKTSLGESIAKALGRKFVRGSLGGVRDDSEIRGHRRTYIGAMPGRIIQGLKRAGVNNPVFMLDEMDKLGRGFQGDPASALLEVLDPEQNGTFLDHYLDVPFDLSHVLFIGTANTLDSIPGPLLDRVEVIELSGYTTAEKLHIAKNHLVPKQLREHGLTPEQLTISDEALMRIISSYTRESGVRDLQRNIAAVARASTERVVKPDTKLPVHIESSDLEELLGLDRYIHEVAERISPPGIVTGLAWTPQGGEILFIETSLMPGSGKLTITGQLGEVMKESAQIALSVVRSNLPAIAAQLEYEKKDIHIHVPAGAIPKDGPSAGIALTTAIASLFSGRSVNSKLAMTGEITLRGMVTPVGGIKEKVIGAHRAGIERIIMSTRNKRDLRDVPEEVKSQMKFEFVETASEVLKLALGIDVKPLTPELTSPPAAPPPALA